MRAYVDFSLTLFWIVIFWWKKSVLLQNEVKIEFEIVAGCCYYNEVYRYAVVMIWYAHGISSYFFFHVVVYFYCWKRILNQQQWTHKGDNLHTYSGHYRYLGNELNLMLLGCDSFSFSFITTENKLFMCAVSQKDLCSNVFFKKHCFTMQRRLIRENPGNLETYL